MSMLPIHIAFGIALFYFIKEFYENKERQRVEKEREEREARQAELAKKNEVVRAKMERQRLIKATGHPFASEEELKARKSYEEVKSNLEDDFEAYGGVDKHVGHHGLFMNYMADEDAKKWGWPEVASLH
jgi:hypothetical protein